MPPLDPENFRDMDEPVNIEGVPPEDVMRALLALDPKTEDDDAE